MTLRRFPYKSLLFQAGVVCLAASANLILAQERANLTAATQKVPGTNYPTVIHICPGRGCNQGNGATIVWENGRYVEHPGGREGATYVIESLTRDRVLILRTDYGRYPGQAEFTGQLSEDGNRIINGKVRWTSHPCCGGPSTGTFQAAWGEAINTIPGRVGDRPAAPIQSSDVTRNANRISQSPPPPVPPTIVPSPPVALQRPPRPVEPPAPGNAGATSATPAVANTESVRALPPKVASPAPPWTSAKRPAHNLNGIWEADFGEPGSANYHRERILVYQLRNSIQMINIQGRRYVRPGTQFLIALDSLDTMPANFKAGVLAPDGKGMMDLYGSSLSVDDPEHLHIANEPVFHRISSLNVDDMACQDGNPNHISAEDAFHRAEAYFLMKDIPTADCWYHVAAEQGHARAQAAYAYALRTGQIGGKPNLAEAIKWATKSSDQRNFYGENELGVEIAEASRQRVYGVTMPPLASAVASGQEVADRGFLHNPSRVFNGDQSMVPVPAAPVIVPDKTLTYEFSGVWKLEMPNQPAFSVTVAQKNGDFEILLRESNPVYTGINANGMRILSGRYENGRITGILLDVPYHRGNGPGGLSWNQVELQIVDGNTLLMSSGVKLTRANGPQVANRACDVVKDRDVPLASAYAFAKTNYANKNYGTTACWLYLSAMQGNPDAALALGLSLHYGISVKKDDTQAFLWFRRAADADMLAAQEIVAHCHRFGVGTPKNPELAKVWDEQAKQQREIAKALLAQRQKEAAQRAKEEREAASWAFLANMLIGQTREDRIESYRAGGMSADAAESRVSDEEDSAAWWGAFGASLFGGQRK